jgi:hypothetical protein
MNRRILQGLFWREWLLHRGELRWIFSAWLLGVWVVPIHPMIFLIPFGVLSACILAPTFGGSDAAEGSEEFSFALPPTRGQRFMVRLALGGGTLLGLLVVALLAGLLNLPQALWSLVFESGYTVPFVPSLPPLIAGLACALTAAAFADMFVAGASSRSPMPAVPHWIRGLLVPGCVMGAGFLIEAMISSGRSGGPNGLVSCPLLGAWTLGRLAYGYWDYGRKEGISGLPPLVPKGRSSAWIILVIVLVVIALFALVFVGERRPMPVQVTPTEGR